MMYLRYDLETGLVNEISENILAADELNGVAQSDKYVIGDEFKLSITVVSVDENGILAEGRSVKNNPQAARLLAENAQLKEEKALLAFELINTQIALDQTQARLEQTEIVQSNLLLTLVDKGVL